MSYHSSQVLQQRLCRPVAQFPAVGRRCPGPHSNNHALGIRTVRTGPGAAHALRRVAVSIAVGDDIRSTSTSTTKQAAPDGSTFSWTKCWYPVHPLAYLDPSKPTATTLLNKHLVLWREAEGQWRCFDDMCAHRLAPLSEGRIEVAADGKAELMCSYHGWRFDGTGHCTRVPQSADAKAEATACASQRSCVHSYPTVEKYGLLWVWPEAGINGHADAAAVQPYISQNAADFIASGRTINWYERSLPYGYDVLVENLCDPGHLPFSHHNLSPALDRRKAKPVVLNTLPMQPRTPTLSHSSTSSSGSTIDSNRTPPGTITGSTSAQPGESASGTNGSGAAATASSIGARERGALPDTQAAVGPVPGPSSRVWSYPASMPSAPDNLLVFTPPSHIVYNDVLGPSGSWVQVELLAVPIEPGRAKVFDAWLNNFPQASKQDVFKSLLQPKTVQRMLARYRSQNSPPWRFHLMMNKLFDQDGIFLAMQGAALQRKGSSSWAKAYYMPTSADAAVIAARKWMDNVGSPYGDDAGKPQHAQQGQQAQQGQHAQQGQQAQQVQQQPRHVMMDRAAQHTAHCTACQAAQAALERQLAVAKLVAAVAGVAMAVALGVGLTLALLGSAQGTAAAVGQRVAIAVVGLGAAVLGGCAAVVRRAKELLPQFSYVEYHHYNND